MLVGVLLRHFKTYSGINYLPITNKEKFTAYVGENGVGKSSILEALDSYFNNKPWVINHVGKKRGTDFENAPFIAPIFAIKKDDPQWKNKNNFIIIADKIDAVLREDKLLKEPYFKFLEKLKEIYHSDKYWLLLHAQYPYNAERHSDSLIPIATVNNSYGEKTPHDNRKKELSDFKDFIKGGYEYIYLPVEINEADFTKLENEGMQKLISDELTDSVSKAIEAKSTAREINNRLQSFLNDLHKKLEHYEYDRATGRANNFTERILMDSIIASYFKTKELVYNDKNYKTPIRDLSAGEKRNAIISVARALLSNEASTKKHIVFAIDEPESSLYAGNCYKQFQCLKDMSENAQIIITTHWYGFLPVIDEGRAHFLTRSEQGRIQIDTLNLRDPRRDIKGLKSTGAGIPFDTRLKSINDLVQSIVSSLMGNDYYNWIVCEGISDKIYLECLIGKGFLEKHRILIIPMAGHSEVTKLYKHLCIVSSEGKELIVGRVFCLVDTDNPLPEFGDPPENKLPEKIVHKRLHLDRYLDYGSTILTYKSGATKTDPTAIEDMLNAKVFKDALKTFDLSDDVSFTFDLNEKYNSKSNLSGCAFELTPKEQNEIKEFFNKNNGAMKEKFASHYCGFSIETNQKELEWVKEFKKFFLNKQ
ncbi:MAG: hypothetical protein CMH27_03510 [Micavibrio sp.]|nr:hypothetical protein [Micavibrio sp.]|tara:strand:+ start:2101 stop:4041 length:1941 start_codon:yes stop_codon:yes gene_type:complete